MDNEKTLYRHVQDAVKQAIAEDETSLGYFTINRVQKILEEMTRPAEWNKRYLFDIVVKGYAAVIATELGYRSGIHGEGVYFSSETAHEFISKGLVQNAEDLAEKYREAFERLKDAHEVKFVRRGMDGQMAFDETGESIIEEMTLATLIKAIKQAEGE